MKIIFIPMIVIALSLGQSDSDCNVIPMTQWAGEPSKRTETLTNPVSLVIIQHSVTDEVSSDEECEETLRSIRKNHINHLTFVDIGTSFFVCGNGKVYEGAGWGLVGAHTKGYNSVSIGLSFIGSFESKLPSQIALNATQDLLNCGVENNHLTTDYQLVGHRQMINTLSPGDSLQKEIESWPHWVNRRESS